MNAIATAGDALPHFHSLDFTQRRRLDLVAKLQAFPDALARWLGTERSTELHKQIVTVDTQFGQAMKPAYLYHVVKRNVELANFIFKGEAA